MCGIFGFVGQVERSALDACTRRLTHRGPDGFGALHDTERGIYLGHTRLAIIDLSDRALQPLANETGDVQIVFNGEIYNFARLREELERLGHQFRSHSDTEVIVHAYEQWGPGCVDRFNGMFAFAIWDKPQNRLFIARDRLGIKPLYVWRQGRELAFASEPQAFFGLPRFSKGVAPEPLARYLAFGYVPGRASIWEGVERVRPGHWLSMDLASGRIDSQQYWKLAHGGRETSDADALARLEQLLSELVGDHLIADVPVGVLLSGGVDSSTVAAHAAAHHPGIEAFSIGIANWDRDERDDSAAIAAHLGLPQFVHVVDTNDFALVHETLGIMDEPNSDTALWTTNAVCRLARSRVKVALTGDGADEVFGGYEWYRQFEDQPLRRRALFTVETIRRLAGMGRPWPRGCANIREYYRLIMAPSVEFQIFESLFPALRPGICEHVAGEVFAENFYPDSGRYRRWQLMDAATYLVDNNLARVDRISMAHGLEARVPLVDHRIVEFALALPEELRISAVEKKVLLKRAARKKLPERLVKKKKQGFSCPVQMFWPTESMADALRSGTMVQSGFVDGDELEKLLTHPDAGGWPNAIWMLAALEYWHRKWIAGVTASMPAVQ